MTTLELENVDFAWSAGAVVISDLSLSVRPGECLHLKGPSGAGKSTTLALAAGLLQPTSGAVTLDGHPANSASARTLRWYMNPAPALYPLLTVGEHLRFYARAHHVGERRALHNLHNLLAGQVDDVLCRDLTSTQAHMVWFTAAISCHGAGLLVLDEPFAAAAPDQTENMISLVQAHVRTGGSVLLSSRVHGNLLSNTRWRTHTLKSPEAP